MSNNFNLIHAPWIPVRSLDGTTRVCNLSDILTEAHTIRSLDDPSPLVFAALHRILLAILYRSLHGPTGLRHAVQLWRDGAFPKEAILTYLHRWEDRFGLFDDTYPFYQVADLESDALVPNTKLAPEMASKHNATWFDHSLDDSPLPMNPAEMARLLVAHQMFALSAGKSPLAHTKDAPAARGAITLALGNTLFETLMLNLVPIPEAAMEHDLPVWERDVPTITELEEGPVRAAAGFADLYTWRSRSVLLHPEQEKGETVVRYLSYASGVEARDTTLHDPMLAYRTTKKAGTFPIRLRVDRALWRDFSALVPPVTTLEFIPPGVLNVAASLRMTASEDFAYQPLRVAVLGLASPGQAKISLWRMERYPLPGSLFYQDRGEELREVLHESLVLSENIGRAISQAGRILAKKVLPRLSNGKIEKQSVETFLASLPLIRIYWSTLETKFPQLLAGFQSRGEEKLAKWWREQLRETAWIAWDATTRILGNRANLMLATLDARWKLAGNITKILGSRSSNGRKEGVD